MDRNSKFGAFSGVFTPSILTILGVIMYLRLGWVVGQAGLIATIAIILLAHTISITTGLSISSIATDKKIKAGGIYYMLSRSLGLPMGGSIGIALTIGTALSISLYIVGFSESFLSISSISNFLNLEPGVQSFRIVGSVVLIVLIVIALISTSFAIKTQYIILGTIVLSLVSIFVGFGIHSDLHPVKPVLSLFSNGVSIEKVFAIFFPAVTGFTAGVAMSGDLKDPKKNIPTGTLLSIAVGFIIYLSLTIGFALFVSRDNLLNDNDIAVHVAWIPSLVFAGIWGATLSSALGGILGGPRILQALSADKVMPVFFAKGYGKSNEPRNALLFIFVIAEAGILIGDLNVIAGVVTMFYLASYGFINLAYVLESLASTDFRPSFKVSYIFGLVGFIFAFAIMFKLDVISMLVAFVIIGLIFFILQRKQLRLDYGDVWQSVWISIIRRGLNALDGKILYDRNWQPNIILFSGGTNKRQYLLEFGKSIVGKFGFLTNFDLYVDKKADVLFPKHKQAILNKEKSEAGIFLRRQSCKDVYEGIEMIVRTYGFSGLEPNTIMLGWARHSAEPKRFVKMLQTINNLDFNLILIDYDSRFKFGKYSQIDIWWRGAGNNGNFALTLAKFLSESEKWENVNIRLMIVNDDDSKAYYLYRRATEILASIRFSAEVKIVNNELEKRSFYEIIRYESKTADIIFIGIPYIEKGKEKDFVAKTNKLLFEIGTVVLIQASSLFKELNLGVNLNQNSVISSSSKIHLNPSEIITETLFKGKQTELHKQISSNFDNIIKIYEKTIQTFIFKEIDDFTFFMNDFDTVLPTIINLYKHYLPKFSSEIEKRSYILKYQKYLSKKISKKISDFKILYFNELQEIMDDVISDYFLYHKDFFAKINNDIILTFNSDDLKKNKKDSLSKKIFKISVQNKNTFTVRFTAKERKRNLMYKFYEILFLDIEQIRIETLRFIYSYEQYFYKIIKHFEELKNAESSRKQILKEIKNIEEILFSEKENLVALASEMNKRIALHRKKLLLNVLNTFLKQSENFDSLYDLKKIKSASKLEKKFIEKTNDEIKLFFNSFDMYISQIGEQNEIEIFKFITIDQIFILKNFLSSNSNNIIEINDFIFVFNMMKNNILKAIKREEKYVEIMDENSFNDSFYKNLKTIKVLKLNLQESLMKFSASKIFDNISQQIDKIKAIDKQTCDLLIENLYKIIVEIEQIDVYKLVSL